MLTFARRANHFVLSELCQARQQEIFRFRFSEKHDCLAASRLRMRGVSRSSRTLEAGCGGCVGVARRAARMRTAKSRGPVPPTLGSSLPEVIRQATVANKPGTPGRSRIRRKPSRRECRHVSAYLCDLLAFVLSTVASKACGCGQHPVFPAPSCFRGTMPMHHPGRSCRGNADARHCNDGGAVRSLIQSWGEQEKMSGADGVPRNYVAVKRHAELWSPLL